MFNKSFRSLHNIIHILIDRLIVNLSHHFEMFLFFFTLLSLSILDVNFFSNWVIPGDLMPKRCLASSFAFFYWLKYWNHWFICTSYWASFIEATVRFLLFGRLQIEAFSKWVVVKCIFWENWLNFELLLNTKWFDSRLFIVFIDSIHIELCVTPWAIIAWDWPVEVWTVLLYLLKK